MNTLAERYDIFGNSDESCYNSTIYILSSAFSLATVSNIKKSSVDQKNAIIHWISALIVFQQDDVLSETF